MREKLRQKVDAEKRCVWRHWGDLWADMVSQEANFAVSKLAKSIAMSSKNIKLNILPL